MDENTQKALDALRVEIRKLSELLVEVIDFQQQVGKWMLACFTPEITADGLERGDRLLEEVLELLQTGGYPPERVEVLRDHVYARPVGDPMQELGGVQVCVAAYANAFKLNMVEAADRELERCWLNIDKIREKQRSKPGASRFEDPRSALP